MLLNFHCASFRKEGLSLFLSAPRSCPLLVWLPQEQVFSLLSLLALRQFQKTCLFLESAFPPAQHPFLRRLHPALSPSCCVQFESAPPVYRGVHCLITTHTTETAFLPPLVCDTRTTTMDFFSSQVQHYFLVQTFEVLQVSQHYSFFPVMIGASSKIVVYLSLPNT